MKKVALGIDLDMLDYLNGNTAIDELQLAWPAVQHIFKEIPQLKTTWFIRIDAHMAEQFGAADHVFHAHKKEMEWLRNKGHELGWHFHSFRNIGGAWKQNADEKDVVEEMKAVFPLVEKQGLKILRMGWAYHNNLTMQCAENLGMSLDCTAFPRPEYTWDNALRNWSQTGQEPYQPAFNNYQTSGDNALSIWEMPMSTVPIPAKDDTDNHVIRYINPAYFHKKFVQAVESYHGNTLNLVAHPYEFLPNQQPHPLMSFDLAVVVKNLHWLQENNYQFVTISELLQDAILAKLNAEQ